MHRSLSILAGLLAAALAAPAPAQTVTLGDLDEERLLRSGIANVVPALALFGVTEGPRYARLHLDAGPLGRVEADLFKIPISHSFAPVFRGIRPHAQLTFGGFAIDKGVSVALVPALPTRIAATIRGVAAIGGIGATIPLGETTTIRPLLLGGHARIRSDATTSGPFSGLLLSLADGILADASIESLVAGASLELRHRARIGGDVGLEGSVLAGYLFAPVSRATDRVFNQTLHFGSVSGRLEADGPLARPTAGLQVRWFGFAMANYVPGDTGDYLGIPAAMELGLGLRVADAVGARSALSGAALRASTILGDGLTGWSLGLSLEF